MWYMKRPNGTGTVVKKPDRQNPYLAYGSARMKDGKRYIPYIGSFKRKADAFAALEAFNQNPGLVRNKLTFQQVYNEFTQSPRYKKLSKSLKDGYSAAYKHCFDLYGLPFAQIRQPHMQAILDDIADKGMSFSSVHKIKVLFSVLTSYAMQTDVCLNDYAQYVEMPEIEQKEKRPLMQDEIQKIADAADQGDKAARWTMYLLYSGWRISEMLELTPDSFNEDKPAFIGGKKTKNGKNRLVPVHPQVKAIVAEQLEQHGETVFCMESGKPMTANYFRKFLWAPMLEKLEIDKDVTPHIARHTFATQLKINGADEFYRKKLLGHSSKDITNSVYTHADYDSLYKTICLLDYKLSKKSGKD